MDIKNGYFDLEMNPRFVKRNLKPLVSLHPPPILHVFNYDSKNNALYAIDKQQLPEEWSNCLIIILNALINHIYINYFTELYVRIYLSTHPLSLFIIKYMFPNIIDIVYC